MKVGGGAARRRRAAAGQRPVGPDRPGDAGARQRLRDRRMTACRWAAVGPRRPAAAEGLSTQPAEVGGAAARARSSRRCAAPGASSPACAPRCCCCSCSRSPACPAASCRSARSTRPRCRSTSPRTRRSRPVLDRLSLFDVFAAPWFAAVYLLLFVSLVGCVVPRTRLHARALRAPPPRVPAPARPGCRAHDRWETDLPADEVAGRGPRRAAALAPGRPRRTRCQRREGLPARDRQPAVPPLAGGAARRHRARRPVRLQGQRARQGGRRLRQRRSSTTTTSAPAGASTPTSLAPFNLTLDDFRATYTEAGAARTFDGRAGWAPGPDAPTARTCCGSTTRSRRRRRQGLPRRPRLRAARRRPRRRGRRRRWTRRSRACRRTRRSCRTARSRCRTPLPAAARLRGHLHPDDRPGPRRPGGSTSVHPAADDPVLTLVGYRGNLGLDSRRPAAVYTLERSAGSPRSTRAPHALRPGETWQLPGGGAVSFEGVDEWITLQVTQDPGKGLALWAAGRHGGRPGAVAARAPPPALGARRPRTGRDGRTVVEVGGLARTDAEAFAAEFAGLAERLRERTGAADLPTTPTAITPRRTASRAAWPP